MGVDAFTIMQIAGRSSVIVTKRYVHPSAESFEIAFERLERFNNQVSRRKWKKTERDLLHLQETDPSDIQELSLIQRLWPLSSTAEQRTHNPLVGGSNPPGATNNL